MAKLELDIDLNPNISDSGLKNAKTKLKTGLSGDLDVSPKLDTAQIMKEIEALKAKIMNDVKLGIDTSELEKDLKNLQSLSEKAGEQAGEALKEGIEKKAKGIDISKVFSAQVLGQAVNELSNTFNSVSQPFIAFDKQLADMSAITGIAGKDLDAFGEKARELALKFGGEASDQIESFKGVLSRLGPDIAKSPEALNKMGEAINTLSKASGMGAAESMDALTTSLLQFGVDLSDPMNAAKEMERAMNVMAAGAKYGAAEIPQVSQAITVAGVAAKGANISIEETNAAIQALAAGGKYGAEAGTALRNVLGKLQDQSGEGSKVLAKMGLTVQELGEQLTTQGISKTMETLGKGINSLGTDAEKNAAMMQLFGQENAAAATIIMRSSDSIKEMTGQLTGTATASEQAAVNMNTVAAKADLFKAKMSDMAITAGSAIGSFGMQTASTMVEVGKVLTAGIQIKSIIPEGIFSDAEGEFLGFKKIFQNTGAAIAQTGSSIAKTAKSIGTATAGIFSPLISSSGELIKTLLMKVVPSFFVTTTTVSATGAAATTTAFSFSAMWAAITGPVGLVIGAIALVGAGIWALYEYCEPVKQAIDGLFSGIVDFAKGVWDGIVGIFTSIWDAVKPVVSYIADAFVAVGTVVAIVLIAPYKLLWELLKAVAGWLADVFVAAWDNVTTGMSNIGAFISDVFVAAWDMLVLSLKTVYEYVTGFFVGAWNALLSLLGGVGSFIGGAFSSVWNGLNNIIIGIGAYLSNTFKGIWIWLKGAFETIVAPIGLAMKAVGYLTDSFRKAGSIGIYVKGVMAGLSGAFTAFGQSLTAMWNALIRLDLDGFAKAFSGMGDKVVSAFKNGMDSTIKSENEQLAKMDEANRKTKEATDNQAKANANSIKAANANASASDKAAAAHAKGEKKKSDATKQTTADILAAYKAQSDALKKQNENYEKTQDNFRLQNDLKKTSKDELESQTKKNEILEKQRAILTDIVSKAGGSINSDGIIVGSKLSKDDKTKIETEFKKVVDDINSSKLATDGIQIKVNLDKKSWQEAYDAATIETAKQELRANLKAGVITKFEFDDYSVMLLQGELDNLFAKKKELEEKVKISVGTANETEARKQLDELNKNITAKQEEIKNSSLDLIEQTKLNQIKAIQDKVQREYELESYNLAKIYDDKLKKAKENGDDTLAITDEYLEKDIALTEKYNQKKQSSFERTTTAILGTVTGMFAGDMEVVSNEQSIENAKSQLTDLASQRSELDKAYKEGTKSYAEYINSLNELDEKRGKAQEAASQKTIDWAATINKALSKSFGDLAKKSETNLSTLTSDYQKALKKKGTLEKQIAEMEKKGKEVSQETLDAKEKANIDATEAIGAAWSELGVAVGATFGQMLAEGNSFLKATVVAALTGLKSIIPILVAEIYGKQFAEMGPLGLATATGLVAILTGLVSAAEAGVKNLKFAKGGLVPGGEKQITVNEQGQEIVMNHIATELNKEALLEINRRNISIEQYAREHNLTSRISSIETAGIESRLERIESAINETARKSTIKAESNVKLEINDKGLVHRVNKIRRQKVGKF